MNYELFCNFAAKMKTTYLNGTLKKPVSCVATIGMFDGVHRGHRFVIDRMRQEAEQADLPSCVITFDRHPKDVVLSQQTPKSGRLTTLDEKLALLAGTGVDLCVVLPFTKEMAALSARQFMQQVLQDQLGVRILLTGYDNHFGHREAGRSETFEDYQRYGRELGMEVKCLPPLTTQHSTLNAQHSSSLIRRLLQEGRIEEANDTLGYEYTMTGTVVSGEHIGRQIGFPTANLKPDDPCKLIPANGVYAVKVRIGDATELPGMTNIGLRPTFTSPLSGESEGSITIETHILHQDGKFYGQHMSISFVSRLRDEQRFDSPEVLVAQLRHDAAAAEALLTQKTEQS